MSCLAGGEGMGNLPTNVQDVIFKKQNTDNTTAMTSFNHWGMIQI